MSFGWSLGDVIAGIKVVWQVYEAVSDGPLNAQYEATQFFDEFIHVFGRLQDWERRRAACTRDERLAMSNEKLREQCTVFLKRHMGLIQYANPNTKAIRQGRTTWLQKVTFSRTQVETLYRKVTWPFERKEVTRLRDKLQLFLALATYDVTAATHTVSLSTNEVVQDIRDNFRSSNAELLSSNLKLVSSHLDLVSLITLNLKRVTYPLEAGNHTEEIDYPMLRQFEQALRPPQPLQALEGRPARVALPWHSRNTHEESEYTDVSPSMPYNRDAGPFDQTEIRGLISRRLDNMSMRIGRADTLESIPELDTRESIITSTAQPLLDRLRDMREQIGGAVGVVNRQNMQQNGMSNMVIEPEYALRQELEEWNHLEERIEREILHPGRLLSQTSTERQQHQQQQHTQMSFPIPIPPQNLGRHSPISVSPGTSYDGGWNSSSMPLSSPDSGRGSLSSSPNDSRQLSNVNSRSHSTTSGSPPGSVRLDHYIPVYITYPNHVVNAVIHSISRFDDGEVHSITATSQDGSTEIRHTIDLKAPALTETSMKPFLDNCHIDKIHRYRVQFQGAHNIKTTKMDKVSRYQSPPIYKFSKEKEFLDFQSILLNKSVVYCADVKYIKSTNDNECQCRIGTIRVLVEPFTKTRHILYFRHTADRKDGFVEWPATSFKPPEQPVRRKKSITLESHDGRSLSISTSRGISRRSTQGSVATINSFESTAGPAFGRMQERERGGGKSVRGLVVEFYDAVDCHKFWEEFSTKEAAVSDTGDDGPALGLGLEMDMHMRAELPA